MNAQQGPVQVALSRSWRSLADVCVTVSILKASGMIGPSDLLETMIYELNVLCGLYNCICYLADNLARQGQTIAPGNYFYVVLWQTEMLSQHIGNRIATASNDEITTMLSNVRFCRHLASRIATFATFRLEVLHETLAGLAPSTPTTTYDVAAFAPTLTGWLNVLNSIVYNRCTLTYSAECGLVKIRRMLHPEYQFAATRWIKLARTNWNIVELSVRQLFAIPTTNNFMQWMVEYARTQWPEIYDMPNSAEPVVKLVDDLSRGSVNPLHVAVMFGFPNLGLEMVTRYPGIVNMAGSFGSPLFCALVGPMAVRFRCIPASWGQLIAEMEPTDVGIIMGLIMAGADCNAQFRIKNIETSSISLAHLGFVASTILEDARVFKAIMMSKLDSHLQEDFTLMMRSSRIFAAKANTAPTVMSDLMTCAFDHSIVDTVDDLPWEDNVVGFCIAEYMTKHGLEFRLDRPFRLPFILDSDFDNVVRQCVIANAAVLGARPVFLERLAADDRFNPNLLAQADSNEDGTIVHSAVGGSHHHVIHELHLADADFEAVDDEGRTPLMVVEDPDTLDILVMQYHVSTTAKNIYGQNIWHLAAATNDVPILKWLCDHDPAKEDNINVVSEAGRTPLVEALICVTVLSDDGTPIASEARAAKMLLNDEMVDPKLSTDLVSIRSLAVRWGDIELIRSLMRAGFDI